MRRRMRNFTCTRFQWKFPWDCIKWLCWINNERWKQIHSPQYSVKECPALASVSLLLHYIFHESSMSEIFLLIIVLSSQQFCHSRQCGSWRQKMDIIFGGGNNTRRQHEEGRDEAKGRRQRRPRENVYAWRDNLPGIWRTQHLDRREMK